MKENFSWPILLTEGLALLPKDPDGARIAFFAGGLFVLLAKANDYVKTHQQPTTPIAESYPQARYLGSRNPNNLIRNSNYLKIRRSIRNGI
jgi:hypothetical protein